MERKNFNGNTEEYIQYLEQKLVRLSSENKYLVDENNYLKEQLNESAKFKQALHINEIRYQTFFENTGTAMAVFSDDCIIYSCNDRFIDLCECSKDEIIGKLHWYDFVHEQDKERMMGYHKLRQQHSADAPTQYHFRFVTKKGNIREIFINIVVLHETNERLASLTDITEMVQLQKEIKKQLHFSESLLSTIPLPIFYKDINGKYLGCNKAFEDLMGVSREEIIGKTVYDLTPADIAYLYAEKDNELFTNRGFQQYEWVLRNKKGEMREVIYFKASFFDENDQNAGIIGTILDVTERNNAIEQLKQSEERFRLFYEQSPIAYQSLDSDGCFIDVNDVWLQILGYQRQQVIGKWFGDFLSSKYKPLFKERFEQFKKTGKLSAVEFEMVKSDKDILYVVFNGKISYDVNGEMIRSHCVFYDLSDRHKAEVILKESEQQLQVIFDATPAIMCLLNEQLEVIRINKTGLQFANANLDEILFKQGGDVFRCIYAAKNFDGCGKGEECKNCVIRNTILKALNEQKNISRVETSIKVSQNGVQQEYFILLSVNILNFADWKGILVTFDNITERKQIEIALQQSEQRYQKITETITDYIYNVKIENNIAVATSHSPTCYGVTGYTKQEFENNSHLWYNIIFDDDKILVEHQLQKLFAFKTSVTIEHRIYKKNGALRWIANTVIPNIDKNGILISYDGIIRDITERKQAEINLLESHQYIESIFKAAPMAIGVVKNRIFDKVNQQMCNMLGYTEEELIGKSAIIIYPTKEEFQKVGEEKYRQITEKGTGTVETRWKCKNGEIIDIILSSTPIDVNDWSKGVTFTAVDITKRKKAELALRRSEEKFRNIVETMNEGLLMVDNGDVILFANNRLCQIFGLTQEELLGKRGLETIIYEEDRNIIIEKNKLRTQKISDSYEIRGKTKSGNIIWLSISGSPVTDDNGNVIGSVGLITDITEKKLAEMALLKSEQRYRTIVDTANEGIWTMDENFVTSYVNTKIALMLGYEPQEMLGKKITDFMLHEEWLDNEIKIKNRSKGISELYERSFVRKDGSICKCIVSATPLMDENCLFRGSFAMLTDISELRRIEAELLEKNQQLESFFNYSIDLLCIANTEGYFLRLNPEWENALGYSLSELEGKRFFDFIHPDDIQATLDAVSNLDNQQLIMNFKNRYRCKDGSYKWIEWRSKPVGNKIYASARDITLQLKLQNELLESEKRNRELIANMQDGVYQSTPDGKFLMVNQAMVRIFGYDSIDEMLQIDIPKQLYPSPECRQNKYPPQLKDEMKLLQLKKKDGTLIWVEENGWYITDENGVVIRHEGVLRDVTERVNMQEALRQSEENLAITLQSIGDGVMATDKQGIIVNMNPVAEMLCGYTLQEAKGKMLTEVFNIVNAETFLPVENPVNKVIETGKVVGLANHTVLLSRTGAKYQIADSAAPIRNRSGEITGVVLVFSDVTEEYELNEKLRLSEERLNLAMAVKNEGVWDWNLITNETFFDDRYYTMAGYEPNEFPQTFDGWASHVHPDDLVIAQKAISDYLSGNINIFDIEFRFLHKNNCWIWIRGRGQIVAWDETGKPIRMIGTHTDITTQKLSQIALQKSEERFRSLVNSLSDVIYTLDLNQRHTGVYGSWVEKAGLTPEFFLGKSVSEIYDNKFAEVHVQANNKALSGEVVTYEWNIDSVNGMQYYQTIIAPMYDADGKIYGLVGAGRNITDRKNAELQLRIEKERLQSIIEATNVGTWEWNIQTGETIFNTRWAEIIGYTLDELQPISINTWIDFCHPDDLKLSNELIEKHINGELDYYSCQLRMLHKNGNWRWVFDRGKVISRTEDGKPLIMMGIHLDITELKLTEQKLKENEEKYRSLFNQSMEGIYLHDLDGKIIDVNEMACKQSGYTKQELLTLTVFDGLPENVSINLPRVEILKLWKQWPVGQRFTYEGVHQRKDGSLYPVEISTGVIQYGDSKAILAIVKDVTERKNAEQKAQEYLLFVQRIAEQSPDFIYVYDIKSKSNVFINKDLRSYLGYTPQQAPEDSFKLIEQLIHPNDLKQFENYDVAIQQWQAEYVRTFEYRLKDADGNWRYFLGKEKEFQRKDGKIVSLIGVVSDVTELKKSELKIKLSEQKYRMLFENMLHGFVFLQLIYDTNNKSCDFLVSEANKAFEDMTGIPVSTVVGKRISTLKSLIESDIRFKQLFDLVKNGGQLKIKHYLHSSNKTFEIFAFRPETDKLALLITDVTESEKQIAEINALNEELLSVNEEYHAQNEELQQTNFLLDEQKVKLQQLYEDIKISEEQYRSLFDNMLNGFALHEIILNKKGKPVDYRFLQVNAAFEKLTGLKADNIVGKTVKEIMPAIEDYWIDTYGKVAVTGKHVRYENFFGELNRYYEVVAYSPKKYQFAVIISDVTERRQLELLEEARKADLHLLSMHAEQLIKVQDLDDFYNLLGKTIQNQIGKGYIAISQYEPSEDCMYLRKMYGIGKKIGALTKILGFSPIGLKIPLSDSVRYLLHNYHSHFYKYEFGLKELFSGVLPDAIAEPVAKIFDIKEVYGISLLQKNFILGSITIFTTSETETLKLQLLESLIMQASNAMQRIMYAEDIKEKEQQFRSIFNNTNDAIFILDANGCVLEANNIACTRLEYTKSELLGLSREQFNHPDYKDVFPNAFKAMKKQPFAAYETIHVTKSGKHIPVEALVNYIEYKGKKCFMVVARDITERKEVEKRIFNAVIEAEEKERLRFSKDLHDGIGALLSSIKIYINLMESSADEHKRQMLIENSKQLIEDAILAAREISHNLQPSTIRDFGLVSSVQSFIDKINKTGFVKVHSRFIHLETRLPENAEVMLYRIITELFNNTLKHAKASEVTLLLARENLLVKLLYADNGIGIAPEVAKQGLGINNIRARVASIDGFYRMETEPGKGLKVSIILDLRKFDNTKS